MNENLKSFIGKPVTLVVKLFIDNSIKEEYVQGILKDVDRDILTVEQHIPFCNLFVKDAKTSFLEREIPINSLKGGIKIF